MSSRRIRVSTLADPKQGRFASGGVLSRNQTEPGSEIPRFPELSGIADRGNQRRRADRPDPGDRHEPTGCVMLCCEYFNLPGNGCKSDIDDLEFIPKLFEKNTYGWRQIVGLIGDDARDVELESACPRPNGNTILKTERAHLAD